MKKHKTSMRLFKYVGARPPSGKLLKTLINKENTTIKELLEEMFSNGGA